MNKFFGALCVVLGLLVIFASVQEQYPSRPVRVISTSPAGNQAYIIAQIMSDALGPNLGVPVKTEAKPGAAGFIGADYARRAKPDGHTLLVGASSTILFIPARKKSAYSTGDFVPICRFGDILPFVITVPAGSPITSVADFVAYNKAAQTTKRGGFTYSAIGGIGGSAYLLAEQLLAIGGFEATFQAPGSQGNSINTDLKREGDIDWGVTSALVEEVRDGKLRVIAVLDNARVSGLPGVPAITEPGLMPALVPVPWWFGLFAPKETPTDVVAKVEAACLSALGSESVRTLLKNAGFTPRPGGASAFRAEIQQDDVIWRNIIKGFQERGVLPPPD